MGHLSNSSAEASNNRVASGKHGSRPHKQNGSSTHSASVSTSVWYAFYIKPRHEKKATGRLNDYYEIYCPLKEERVKWSDRWKTVTKPYIPGYIFARVTEKERLDLLDDPAIFRTVCWKGQPAVIREEEINTVKKIIGDPDVKNVQIEAISPGDRVEVKGGKMANVNGEVVAVKGNRAVLRLDSLRCNITFTLRKAMLEKCVQ